MYLYVIYTLVFFRVIAHVVIFNVYVNYAYWCCYHINICIMVLYLYLIAILLTYFVYLNQQKITKKRFEASPICCLVTYFGTNKSIFASM